MNALDSYWILYREPTARSELGDVEDIEAFDEDYKRGVLDVMAEKAAGLNNET